MRQNEKENWEWLEEIFREYNPKIKILNKAIYHDTAYSIQVKLEEKVEKIEFRRYLVDDRSKDQILSIIRERLG